MKNDYCIIKVYAATNNEYVVKNGLTFDEAQAEFERYNSSYNSSGEPCMYIIGDGTGDLDHLTDDNLLDKEDDEDFGYSDLELDGFSIDTSYREEE